MQYEIKASSWKYSSLVFVYGIMQTTQHKIVLVCIYEKQKFPCSTFCTEFKGFMESSHHKEYQIIVTRDFNVWNEENEVDSTNIMTMMNACGLTESVKEATHKRGHRLNNV